MNAAGRKLTVGELAAELGEQLRMSNEPIEVELSNGLEARVTAANGTTLTVECGSDAAEALANAVETFAAILSHETTSAKAAKALARQWMNDNAELLGCE